MKRRIKIFFSILFLVLVTLIVTKPSEQDYYEWLAEEYTIEESSRPFYYQKEEKELFDLGSHKKMFGIFTTRLQNFEYAREGKVETEGTRESAYRNLDSDEGITVRTLEIGSKIFSLEKENILWRALME